MKKVAIVLSLFALSLFFINVSLANHSWGNYHWARTANPFTLKLGDNLTPAWDPYLATASTDWNISSVLNTTIVPGLVSPKTCKGTNGRVEICNSKYGNNGWLGIAQIWASGSHITKGVVKMNDTYFNTPTYNTPAWKNLVLCQEVGHTFGLDHQDEVFDNPNLDTCMDYTNNPESNQHPNQHDYDQLEAIYAHLDTSNLSFSNTPKGNHNFDLNDPAEWGKAISSANKDGKKALLYEKDLGNGEKVFTHVYWVE